MGHITGGCLCGEVRYECESEPVVTAICNCTNCQRQTASAFSVIVGVSKGSIKFTSGKTAFFESLGDSGKLVYRHFCNKCGTPIYSDVESTPDLDWIKQGSVDDTSKLTPQISLYMKSAQDWVTLNDSIAQFQTTPPAQ